ncbi:MAG TPA: hypothetical protein VIL20_06200 [Sandaracinaceae bacterium]
MTSRHVKGALFADYVRMIRRRKNVDWADYLSPNDLAYLERRIDPDGWYPMATFERLGNAILAVIAGGNVERVRMWGRFQVEPLVEQYPTLVAHGDPMESLMRFHVLRSTFFDYPAVQIVALTPDHAEIAIDYHMGPTAEEAASYQAMGFFEGLLSLAGAKEVEARFTSRSWCGGGPTRLVVTFST